MDTKNHEGMTTKEYLSQISRLNRMIQNKLSEIYQIKTSAYGMTVSNDSDRVQTSPDKDKIGAAVSKIVDLENETDFLVDMLVDLKKEIYFKMNMLKSERHKEILIKKYLENKSIYTIAEELDMSDRGCKKAHKRALEEFGKINKNTKYCIILDSSPLYIVK